MSREIFLDRERLSQLISKLRIILIYRDPRMDQQELQERLGRFEEACRKIGLKSTHQRREIYRSLLLSEEHPTAERLHQSLRHRIPSLSLDTVYRTLGTFALHGLIHKVETGESQARFEVLRERHHHLICRHCKQIKDFHWPSLDEIAFPSELRAWGAIDSWYLVAYGICRECGQVARHAFDRSREEEPRRDSAADLPEAEGSNQRRRGGKKSPVVDD